MTTGEIIKKYRKDLGLSQEELGKRVGVNKAAVQKWESGTVQNIKRSTLKRLSELFGISPTELLGFGADKTSVVPALTADEQKLLSLYAALNGKGKEKVQAYIEDLSDNPKYTRTGGDNSIGNDIADTITKIAAVQALTQTVTKQK